MIKKVFILFLLINLNLGNQISCQEFTFNSQDELDQFPIDFPNLEFVDGLFIYGENITSLEPLSSIKTIGNYLRIENTSIVSLDGLNNLQMINGMGNEIYGLLLIENNEVLESLEAISKLSFLDIENYIEISNNPNLNSCELAFLCENTLRNEITVLHNNGINCSEWESLMNICDFDNNLPDREELFTDDFENWNEQDYADWNVTIEVDDENVPNFELVQGLNNGDSAILLRSNILFFEGPISSRILKRFDTTHNEIDISFDFKCIGEGYCSVGVFYTSQTQSQYGPWGVWRTAAGNGSIHRATIKNIIPPVGFKIGGLTMAAGPKDNGAFSYGLSEFTIDNLKITKQIESKKGYKRDYTQYIYPNPTNGELTIFTKYNIESINLYTIHGQFLGYLNVEEIDLTNLSTGMYLLEVLTNETKNFHRVIKK